MKPIHYGFWIGLAKGKARKIDALVKIVQSLVFFKLTEVEDGQVAVALHSLHIVLTIYGFQHIDTAALTHNSRVKLAHTVVDCRNFMVDCCNLVTHSTI